MQCYTKFGILETRSRLHELKHNSRTALCARRELLVAKQGHFVWEAMFRVGNQVDPTVGHDIACMKNPTARHGVRFY
jgi:hypothetical protein